MSLVLAKGEEIIYERNYAKSFGGGIGNITITNKRFISMVTSKRIIKRHEYKVDEVGIVKTSVTPVNVLCFILTVIFGLGGYFFFELPDLAKKVESLEAFSQIPLVQPFMWICIAFAVISLIIGLLSLRNGFCIKINAQQRNYYNPISTVGSAGKVKPIKLRPKLKDAEEIMSSVPAALAKIKYNLAKEQ